jgi:lipid A 3-O-deacylase
MTRSLILGLMLLAAPSAARADHHEPLNLIEENDSFIGGVDRHYTQGLQLSQTFAPAPKNGIDDFVQNLMLPGGGDQWRSGWFAGQTMYTPENLFAANPPTNDQPYGGWLYGGLRDYRYDDDVLDKVEITLGVTGPASLAGNVQKWWHAIGLFGGVKPDGWHYQLRDEPGLILSDQRIWRVTLADGPVEAEILPEANIAVGNIFDYAAAGGMFRIGQNLKADWGPPRIQPALSGADFQSVDDFAWYAFAGAEGRAMGRNIFLDGNTFESSRSVAKDTLVWDLDAGLALQFPAFRILGSYSMRSREFVGQRQEDQLASFTLSFGL